MKNYLSLFFILIVLLTDSCKEKITDGNEIQTEQKKTRETLQDTVEKKKKIVGPKIYDYKYVVARSGLNYRDLPKGKVLGKFPLNTYLRIIEHTNISDQVKDEDKMVDGEWVGALRYLTEREFDTVYVFNGFLSDSYVQSDIKLYYASSFLYISETYFNRPFDESGNRINNTILTESNLKKDTIRLNKSQRNKFLKFSNILESDKIFIYSIINGNIQTLNVKDLPIIACINIYFHGEQYEKSEFDYEFGFDLGENSYGDFVFIGKENPFQTGKLKPMLWKKISTQEFNTKFSGNSSNITKQFQFEDSEKGDVYKFSMDSLNYYIQNLNTNHGLKGRFIIVINSKTNKIVYENIQMESESTYLIPLRIDNKVQHYSQYTGQLFKNKATVMFGFLSYSFGCPSITILDETEPQIPILCDNRH